jgi:hypothetical protein
VCDYIRQVTGNQLSGPKKEMRFHALESSIQAAFQSLPPWLILSTQTRFDYVPLTSRQPIHWIYTNVILCSHCIALLLYKTKLLNTEEPVTDEIIQKVEHSAEAITFVTSLFLRDNPNFLYINPYISTKIFEAGLAWLSLYKCRPQSQASILLSYDYKLSLLITALENLGGYFDLAKEQAQELKTMKMSRFTLNATVASPSSILG